MTTDITAGLAFEVIEGFPGLGHIAWETLRYSNKNQEALLFWKSVSFVLF